jgi:hypothetical protein
MPVAPLPGETGHSPRYDGPTSKETGDSMSATGSGVLQNDAD